MAIKLSICVDLGSDTLKIVCAYVLGGVTHTDKVVDAQSYHTAIPAAAYYNAANRTWRYGYQLFDGSVTTFDRVVKIKDLLSLLTKYSGFDDAQLQDNVNQYQSGNTYAYYDFPVRQQRPQLWSLFCTDPAYKDSRFRAEQSPRTVCEGYFDYVYNNIMRDYLQRLRRQGVLYSAATMAVTLLCPSRIGNAFTSELERLVRKGFYIDATIPVNVLTPNKALGVLAVYNGCFSQHNMLSNKGERALIFHIGEEQISVAKFAAYLVNGCKVFQVEGISGHNQPKNLGGNNIDKAISDWFTQEIGRRESVGNVQETSTRTANFYLMRAIKAAKYLLAKDAAADEKDYPNGVPIRQCRDAIVGAMLTQEKLSQLLCDSEDVQAIARYIAEELSRPGNRDINHVYLAGGASTTCGLLSYLRRETETADIALFDSSVDCDIPAYELNVYAAAIGAAQMALRGDHIDSVLTRTYGVRHRITVRLSRTDKVEKETFLVLAGRGEQCANLFKPSYQKFRYDTSTLELGVYSTALAPAEFQSYIGASLHEHGNNEKIEMSASVNTGISELHFPNGNENYYRLLQEKMDFYAETDEGAKLQLFWGSTDPANLIKIPERNSRGELQKLYVAIGVQMDEDGYVVPKVSIPTGTWTRTINGGDDTLECRNASRYTVIKGGRSYEVPLAELIVAFDRQMTIDPGLGRGV